MPEALPVKITLELKNIGSNKDWLLVIDYDDKSQERGWVFRKQEIEKFVKELRKLY